jgi:hypothetical protein
MKSVPGAYVSAWLTDVVKLAQSRIDESIILSFIDSAGTFNLDPDQIIYLRDLGLPPEVINAMIQHDLELVSGLRQMPANPSPSPAAVHLSFVKNPSPGKPEQKPEPVAAVLEPAGNSSGQASAFAAGSGPEELAASDQDNLSTQPCSPACQRQIPAPRPAISPVRQPYPVQLLDPIIIIRGEGGRHPNLIVIDMGR